MTSSIIATRAAQYVSLRYTERLAEAVIEPSVGRIGASYDNALAETINGQFKAEVIQSTVVVLGGTQKRWNSPRSNGWTGSTTASSSSRSAIAHPSRPRRSTMRLPSQTFVGFLLREKRFTNSFCINEYHRIGEKRNA